jgi:hypothetical protein
MSSYLLDTTLPSLPRPIGLVTDVEVFGFDEYQPAVGQRAKADSDEKIPGQPPASLNLLSRSLC